GRPCAPGARLPEGGVLTVYGTAESSGRQRAFSAQGAALRPEDIVYEDEHLLLLWKPAGLLSQPDAGSDSLESRARRYLAGSGQWDPEREGQFAPSLCHRLDRGTEGLVMAAKNAEALRLLTEKLRTREIQKTYQCVVRGRPEPESGLWEDFLFKDAKKGRVYAQKASQPGAKYAALRYRTLETRPELSWMEVELLTGRTHQIRVQFASRGWPLLGDGRYGSAPPGGPKLPYHALCATRLAFAFQTPAGILEPLRGRIFERKKTFDFLY
ncbi:MAG: RluA family pseudouridine synthase, partial [Oscillospiraceae bacterium]|nr:RluA family pseudouridine synthase [Oscillospiraceae bacterium]